MRHRRPDVLERTPRQPVLQPPLHLYLHVASQPPLQDPPHLEHPLLDPDPEPPPSGSSVSHEVNNEEPKTAKPSTGNTPLAALLKNSRRDFKFFLSSFSIYNLTNASGNSPHPIGYKNERRGSQYRYSSRVQAFALPTHRDKQRSQPTPRCIITNTDTTPTTHRQ